MNPKIRRPLALLTAACGALLLLLFGTATASAAPPNDNLSGAQLVGPVPVAVPGDSTGATAEIGEPAHYSPAKQSVWYSWTASFTGTAVVDVCDNGYDPGQETDVNIAVYTGTNYANLSAALEDGSACILRVAVANGINYKVAVDFRQEVGPFTFRLRQLTPPANDNFASATLLPPAIPQTIDGSNIDSTWENGENGLGGSSDSRSVWYRWTPAANGRVRFDVCQFDPRVGASNRTLAVYTGNTLATLVEVARENTKCKVDVNVLGGTQYRIAFSGSDRGEGQFQMKLIQATPPPNDNFGVPMVVGPALPVSVDGDNDFATDQPNEPTHGGIGVHGFYSLWYSWTPAVSQTVRVRVCSPNYRAHLGLYTGNTLTTLTEVGEHPPFGPYCSKVLDAVAGTTYRIAAAGNNTDNTRGPFTLDIHALQRPANDDLAAAAAIGPDLPVTVTGSTSDSTAEPDEPGHPDPGYGAKPGVWYGWTPAKSGSVTVSVCGTTLPGSLSVFKGVGYDQLQKVAANDTYDGTCPGEAGGTTLQANVEAGQPYRLRVANMTDELDFGFALSIVSNDPPVIDPPRQDPPKIDPPVAEGPTGGTLKREIKSCKQKFKGKSKKAKRKRANCIRKAKLKAAVAKCRATRTGAARAACVKQARRKFSARKVARA